MDTIVLKFGGSSVADTEKLKIVVITGFQGIDENKEIYQEFIKNTCKL